MPTSQVPRSTACGQATSSPTFAHCARAVLLLARRTRSACARGLDTFVNREIKVELTDRGGGVEHVWVRVERATGDQFVGTILNKPVGKHFPPLAPGQRVRMMARDVSALSENDEMGCACA